MKKVTSIQLIGVKIEVTDSNNQKNIGIHGKVIDETKNSLIIKDPSGEKKRLIKKKPKRRIIKRKATRKKPVKRRSTKKRVTRKKRK